MGLLIKGLLGALVVVLIFGEISPKSLAKQNAEAFAMYQSFLALKKEAWERYVKQCGPVTHADMLGMERYAWLDDPWPWDYDRQREG